MKYFFDTSALAKRYIREPGSSKVNEIFHKVRSVYVSIVCLPEIFSALNRLRREKAMSQDQYQRLKEIISHDFESVHVCDLTPPVIAESLRLLESHPLRAMDAIHLAGAIVVGAKMFVPSDLKQGAIAKELELRTVKV